jgi:hypothetical protein
MFVTGRPLESVCVSPNAAEGENEAGVLVGPPAASPKTGWDGMKGTGEARQNGVRTLQRAAATVAGATDCIHNCWQERQRESERERSKHEHAASGEWRCV